MDFSFTDEQRALQDTLARFVQRGHGFEARRQAGRRPPGLDSALWARLAELGVPALTVPEADGGLGGGPTDTLLAMQALGPGLLLAPVLSSAVIATALLDRLASGEQRKDLAALASGEQVMVLAHAEPGSWDPALPLTCAQPASDGAVLLNGHKTVVLHAPGAQALIVSASEGEPGAQRLSLWLVPAQVAGLQLQPYRTLDAQPAAEVRLVDVALPASARLGETGSDVRAGLQAALDVGLAGLCAEAVGIMDATVAGTAEYLRTRQQFGQPIGRFQALQHRMADMLMHLEQARSMACLAAIRCTEADGPQRRQALHAAKVVVSQAARFVGQQAVQLHGGMGMTDEMLVSHQFKRLTAIELSMGQAEEHLQAFTDITVAAALAAAH